jgi:hypothetical protein
MSFAILQCGLISNFRAGLPDADTAAVWMVVAAAVTDWAGAVAGAGEFPSALSAAAAGMASGLVAEQDANGNKNTIRKTNFFILPAPYFTSTV